MRIGPTNTLVAVLLFVFGIGFMSAPRIELGAWLPPAEQELEAHTVEVVKASSTSRSAVSGFKNQDDDTVYRCYIALCGDYTSDKWIGKKLTVYTHRDKVLKITDGSRTLLSYQDAISKTMSKVNWGVVILGVAMLVFVAGQSKDRKDLRGTRTP